MREIFFDPKAGAFSVSGRGAIGLSASFDEVNAALGPEVRIERTGARGVIHARVALGERALDATFTLGSKGIESASFSGMDDPRRSFTGIRSSPGFARSGCTRPKG